MLIKFHACIGNLLQPLLVQKPMRNCWHTKVPVTGNLFGLEMQALEEKQGNLTYPKGQSDRNDGKKRT